jgi:hypothetical protein
MKAIQSSKPPLQTVEPRRANPQIKRRRRPRSSRVRALEATVKLAVNVVVSAAAVYGLVKLLPYQWSQQEKLWEIQTEVNLAEGRVNRLRADFNRYFDPQQAKSIMQEQSNRVDPGQRPVILLDEATTEAR